MAEVQFQDFSEEIEKDLFLILQRITHHIHPDIVEYIKQENVSYADEFKNICSDKLDCNPFFYDGSDCVFPGVRRPINKETIKAKRKGPWKNKVFEDGTILNDNTFPRHIWSYLAENKGYSGGKDGIWNKSGLSQFELAHVFGHKIDERELEKKVFANLINKPEPYGMFTSASNVVLIPKGFAKPTDHMDSIKVCFYKRHMELYGNNVIGASEFNEFLVPSWYNEALWRKPILPEDWRGKIGNLLKYRMKYLRKKYEVT